jgi:hypothetical protein
VPVWAGKTFYGENINFAFLASPLKCLFKTILTDLSPLCFLQLLKFEKAKWVQHVRFLSLKQWHGKHFFFKFLPGHFKSFKPGI